MPRITYITHDEQQFDVDVQDGTNLMQAAVSNGVPGIDGDCGGNCACATCHVYIDPAWRDEVGGPASDMEKDLLGFADGADERSRLGCQISMNQALDGIVVRLPLGQH